MVRLTDRPDMTFDVYRGRKATTTHTTHSKTETPNIISVIVLRGSLVLQCNDVSKMQMKWKTVSASLISPV